MRFARTISTILLGTAATVAFGVDIESKPDGSWISLSGSVVAPTASSFLLDYGEGTVTVEVDDWDDYGDAHGLLDGDEVTVYGRVDDDLYQATTIEASSVYVENLNTYFYASSADEEDSLSWVTSTPIVLGQTNLRGEVTSVNAAERQFTIDTGLRMMTVEAEQLGYNPFDDLGYQKIEKGDRVSVTGDLDMDFFEGRVLDAEVIITLSDNSKTSDDDES